MTHIVFVAAKRTPFGTFGGSLSTLTATDLAEQASRAALAQGNISPEQIDHVIFGNVIQSSSDAAYLARHVGLRVGVPQDRPALTLNRLCGSGFEAIASGVRHILTGEATTVLAGGTENMSQAPYVLRNARFGYRMNHGELEDSLMGGLRDAHVGMIMGETAELLAQDNGFSRNDCDTFALRSQQSAAQAQKDGAFKDEIAPVTLKSRKGETVVDQDEGVRADSSLEKLGKLKPIFSKDGVVTAGNASTINDGAGAVIITTRENAQAQGWPVLAEWISSHVVGCDPKRMGLGPVEACRGALKKADLKPDQVKLFEVNEAFASQYLAVEKQLELPRDKTNVHGGAIALGHPLAASGARITAHLIYALRSAGGGIAVGSACIGGGQGIAVVVKV